MRILLDNCVDQEFAKLLSPHEIIHARKLGWAELSNGKLLQAAEDHGFHAMVTVDKNIRHQQGLKDKNLSVITIDYPRVTLANIAPAAQDILQIMAELPQGSFINVEAKK